MFFPGSEVSPECVAELRDMRKSLMNDYKISPDIVADCATEIQNSCNGGLQREGKTLHCLMDLARPNKGRQYERSISPECKASVSLTHTLIYSSLLCYPGSVSEMV